jgi:hypothetical protein
MKGNYEDDILEKGPPLPALKDSKSPRSGPGGGSSMPRPSSSSESAAGSALSAMGEQPTKIVVSGMAEIENILKRLTQYVPGLADTAAPFVAQMRDLGAGALASLVQGGIGTPNLGAGAPPPMPGGGAAPAGPAPMPGGGAGLPMMPPPPM